MGLLRTLGFTLCITIIFSAILAGSVFQVPAWQKLGLFAVLGLLFYYLFGPDDNMHSLGLVFITSAVFLTITGFLGNAALEILGALTGQVRELSGPVGPGVREQIGSLATIFGKSNVLLGLILLFVGLFGPALALLQLKEKQKIDWGILIRSAISIGLVYLLVFFAYQWALARVLGAHMVAIG